MKIKKFIIGLSCIFLITTLRQNVEAKKRVENEITHNFSKAQIPSEAQQWNGMRRKNIAKIWADI